MKRSQLSIAVLAILPLFTNHTVANNRNNDSIPLAVYTMSNATSGNEILMFNRAFDGTLSGPTAIATGGNGSGGSLGNQGGLILTNDRRWLLSVNAGSDSISVFRVTDSGLMLTDTEDSQGDMPVSLTSKRGFVYVLNAGDDSIAGFVLADDGDLLPIEFSKRPLSGSGVAAAQIGFHPFTNHLVVTEKASNMISVFEVCGNGYADPAPVSSMSSTPTPFGFGFSRLGGLIVSEAAGGATDASALSAYRIRRDGELVAQDPSVATTETAACWVAVHPQGRFAYTTNTGSNTISGYIVNPWGNLRLIDEDGVTAETGAGPIDLTFSRGGAYLYSLNAGDDSISVFDVVRGGLVPLQTVEGLPDGANGLAAY